MGLFRSEDMSLFEISIPKDNVWDIMNTLGKLDAMHFIDLNINEQPFNLVFSNNIKRCDDTLRRINFIKDECRRLGVDLVKPKNPKQFLDTISKMQKLRKTSASLFFEEIEKSIKEKEAFAINQVDILKKMHEDLNRLVEYKVVLSKAASILGKGRIEKDDELNESKSIHQAFLNAQEIMIGHIAGTVLQEEQERFNRLIFRATRGNAMVYFKPFKNPIIDYVGRRYMKSTYIVIFQDGEFIRDRIIRICDSFMGERFDIPSTNFAESLKEVEKKVNDSQMVLLNTKEETKKYLTMINTMEKEEASALIIYEWFVIKERYAYNTLNKLRRGDRLFFGLYWIPNTKTALVNEAIYKMKEDRNLMAPQITKRIKHEMTPPSYFYLNEYTAPFQEITDTYGVPQYKEVNSGIFNLVTFPMLFGVMFGDIGHGGMMFIFGIVLVMFPDFFNNLGLSSMTRVRYLVLMLGLFSTFCGLCYNDFMSIPIEFGSGSCYVTEGDQAIRKEDCMYPLGMDPKWYLGKNGLTYFNSMKMKLSVIFGVAQMSIGILMKGMNSLYFCRGIDFIFEFLPQIILMLCLFGYMDYLIIVKWLTPWEGNEHSSPAIIATMIGMFLKFGEIPEGSTPLIGTAEEQQLLSNKLLLIGL